MIVIMGCSASGKSCIEKKLNEKGFDRITSYTSRPIRKNETDHIDYHFISDEDFKTKLEKGFFAESTNYNSWLYGIAKEDCKDNAIAVVEFFGFLELQRNKDLNIISFFIDVEERERVIRMMKRGDNVMESFRRIISDQGSFSGAKREVDHVIPNPDGKLDLAVEKIISILNS